MPRERTPGWTTSSTELWASDMIGSYMKYGALSSKARAMYGKRLRLADFEHMASLTDPRDVLDCLRSQPGWSETVSSLSADQGYVGRLELEEALDLQLSRDYESLSHFVPKEDRALVAFPVRRKELEEIMTALRSLKSGVREQGTAHPVAGMKVDRAALHACTNYGELLAAVRESIYHPMLHRLTPAQPEALPDYAATEAILRGAYYSYLYKTIDQHYAGETKHVLLRALGEQVDLLNLIYLLRLKTYFPGEDGLSSVLFPFGYKLKSEKMKALRSAAGPDEVFALLQDTPYAKALEGLSPTTAAIEAYYRKAFYQFNRRQLTAGEPSVYTAVACLTLKELELQALVNVIESVKYGVRYDDSFARMAGD